MRPTNKKLIAAINVWCGGFLFAAFVFLIAANVQGSWLFGGLSFACGMIGGSILAYVNTDTNQPPQAGDKR